MYGSLALLLLAAVGPARASAHDFDKRAPHANAAAAAKANRLLKRYPPGRETFAITTTPAYEATSTVISALGTATQVPSGAFNPNAGNNPLAATPTTCAPTYTAPNMIMGTGTLPKPSSFIRKGFRDQFLNLDGLPFTIVGPNIYWICQDENYGPVGSYTDKGRVREALAIAVAMGANTIRLHSCGISTGNYYGQNPYNLNPGLYQFNDAAWDIRDYVIYAAGQYGLRVVLPLTDNYKYYHGGKYDFINFRGASSDNAGAALYTNRNVQNSYLSYVGVLLSRVNPYNGVAYKDDPTILAWETGNELGGYIEAEMWPPGAWTKNVVNYINGVDKNHLIIDGTNGFYNYTTKARSEGLLVPGIAIVTDHGYPRNTALINTEYGITAPYFKNFLIGEFDWTTTQSSQSLAAYLSLIESWKPNVGDLAWSVFGHDPQCCNFVQHNDGYSLYYPNGNSAADENNVLLLVQHWYRQTNRPIPSQLVGVACPQPVF
ncbi:hypothetical protein JCM10908_005235 [Rhodotorula pacifica]|uniref:uncharacterized protein n=1 Tax=Rhodotorula pacifica TaxID=1495444 RepID=UPI00316DAC5B